MQMGYKTRSILSMAIKDSEGEVIGVAQAINKNSVKDEPFDEHDEKVSLFIYLFICFLFCMFVCLLINNFYIFYLFMFIY